MAKIKARVLTGISFKGVLIPANSVIEGEESAVKALGGDVDTAKAAVDYALSEGAEVFDLADTKKNDGNAENGKNA